MGSLMEDLIRELEDPEFTKLFGAEMAKSGFAFTLLDARKAAGMTQTELSEQLGMSQPYIAKLESGEANPTLGKIGSILAVLGFRLVTSLAPLVPDEAKDSPTDTGAGLSLNLAKRKTRKPVLTRL